MKLGIALVIIGGTDIALSFILGVLGGSAWIRLIIDILLITWGVRRIRRHQYSRGGTGEG